jgi:hypothetical protein
LCATPGLYGLQHFAETNGTIGFAVNGRAPVNGACPTRNARPEKGGETDEPCCRQNHSLFDCCAFWESSRSNLFQHTLKETPMRCRFNSLQDAAYAFLRIVAGANFAIHGLQNVIGMVGGTPSPAFSQIWFGGLIELVCGIAIAVGLRTRWAAFLASGTMAVAYFQFHWKLQMGLNFGSSGKS